MQKIIFDFFQLKTNPKATKTSTPELATTSSPPNRLDNPAKKSSNLKKLPKPSDEAKQASIKDRTEKTKLSSEPKKATQSSDEGIQASTSKGKSSRKNPGSKLKRSKSSDGLKQPAIKDFFKPAKKTDRK